VLDLDGWIDAAELPGGQLVVTAHGPLDERVAGALRDALVPIAGADGTFVVLDLQDAHGLDDAALAVIGRAAELVRRRGERLAIVTHSPFVSGLVAACGLADIVTLFPSLREAIAGD
jgi:anti-anti-sigma factor